MRKDRFYLSNTAKPEFSDRFTLHKLRNVLRKKSGETLYVFDGEGREYEAKINEINRDKASLGPLRLIKEVKNKPPSLSLAFCLLKSSKVDFIIQKASELGIDSLLPFISENSVAGTPGKAKIAHWQKISIEAAAQSGRLYLPHIEQALSFEEVLQKSSSYDLVLAGDPRSKERLKQPLFTEAKNENESVLLIVGPEGGFSPREVSGLKTLKNIRLVKLSNFTLRAETAAIFISGMAANFLGKNED